MVCPLFHLFHTRGARAYCLSLDVARVHYRGNEVEKVPLIIRLVYIEFREYQFSAADAPVDILIDLQEARALALFL